MSEPTRLLIVDDSALYRQAITNVLRDAEDVTVVGIAKDGVEALEKIEALDPDLLTLDVQMPQMDGIAVLREISRRRLRTKAIVVSSLTTEGARVTTDALLEGAFDFILKPSGGDLAENRTRLREALDEKIEAFRQALHRRRRLAGDRMQPTAPPTDSEIETEAAVPGGAACRAVLMATSTGGPAALKAVVPLLPADFPVPLLVVQHMPPQYTESLARRLNEASPLDVAEAADGAELRPGQVLIAPGGRHMKLMRRSASVRVRITDEPPENGCRPAADYLFRSAVPTFDGEALGVIMTGMGRDGLKGCEMLKAHGGHVFAQDEESSTVYGMPRAVVEEGLADRIVPLDRIGSAVTRYVTRSHRPSQGIRS